MSDGRKLNIVDENDNVVGVKDREEIHKEGFLHREVHVWLYTPLGEIIFQHRAKDKDTYPNLLDASAGGHVEIGDSYADTAIKELREETGLEINAENLIFIVKTREDSHDQVTGKENNTFRSIYAYRYEDGLNNLKIEKGKALFFESWPINKIINLDLTEEERKKFVPDLLKNRYLDVFKEIKRLFNKN